MNKIKIEMVITNHKSETVNSALDKLLKCTTTNDWAVSGNIKEITDSDSDKGTVFYSSTKAYSAGLIYRKVKGGFEPIPNTEEAARAAVERLNKERGYL